MEKKHEDHRTKLTSYVESLHEKNRKHIKTSGIILLLLPVVLGLIRWLTDSDKTLFLIIWVLCMFFASAYLISVEYLDHILQKLASDDENDAEEGGGE